MKSLLILKKTFYCSDLKKAVKIVIKYQSAQLEKNVFFKPMYIFKLSIQTKWEFRSNGRDQWSPLVFYTLKTLLWCFWIILIKPISLPKNPRNPTNVSNSWFLEIQRAIKQSKIFPPQEFYLLWKWVSRHYYQGHLPSQYW